MLRRFYIMKDYTLFKYIYLFHNVTHDIILHYILRLTVLPKFIETL